MSASEFRILIRPGPGLWEIGYHVQVGLGRLELRSAWQAGRPGSIVPYSSNALDEFKGGELGSQTIGISAWKCS